MSAEELQRLKDVVKGYEAKLAALNALNSALQKENEQLRVELDDATQPKTETEFEAQELKEEFARRLGEQQRTIDILKDTNQKLQAKVRNAAADSSATEAQLSTLQDKIAKQQQEISNHTAKTSELQGTVKKANARIRELESECDKQASKVHVLTAQLEEAQHALAAAQQSAAVELQLLQQQHQEAIDVAQQQSAQTKAQLEQQLATAQATAAAGNEQAAAAAAEREAALAAALADAQAAVAAQQAAAAEVEQRQRRSLARLQDQIRQLEAEKQELLSSSGDASSSLMRQIQALAQQATASQASAAEQEQQLLMRLRAAEQAAAEATAAEREAAGRAASAEAGLQAASEAAASAVQECASLRSRLEAALRHSRTLEAERNGAQERLAAAQGREQAAAEELQQQQAQAKEQLWGANQKLQLLVKERDELQAKLERLQQLQDEAAAVHAEHKAVAASNSHNHQQQQEQRFGHSSMNNSHTGSELAAAEVGMSALGLEDGRLQNGPQVPRASNSSSRSQEAAAAAGSWSHDGVLGSMLQQLHRTGSLSQPSSTSGSPLASQARLQQLQLSRTVSGVLTLEGQQQLQRVVQQLQQELAAVTKERDAAAEQLYQAVRQADAAVVAAREVEKWKQQHAELEHKLNVAVEIIGERSLRIEELEEDIADMKAIFHAQLEEAVRKMAEQQQQQGRDDGSLQPHNSIPPDS